MYPIKTHKTDPFYISTTIFVQIQLCLIHAASGFIQIVSGVVTAAQSRTPEQPTEGTVAFYGENPGAGPHSGGAPVTQLGNGGGRGGEKGQE